MKIILFLFIVVSLLSCDSPVFHMENPVEESKVQDQSTPNPTKCSTQFKNLKLCIATQWLVNPSTTQASQVKITLYSPESGTGTPSLILPPLKFHAYLWMPEHGHGSSPIEITEVDGSYLLSDIWFIMPGLWELRLEVLKGTEIVDLHYLRLTL